MLDCFKLPTYRVKAAVTTILFFSLMSNDAAAHTETCDMTLADLKTARTTVLNHLQSVPATFTENGEILPNRLHMQLVKEHQLLDEAISVTENTCSDTQQSKTLNNSARIALLEGQIKDLQTTVSELTTENRRLKVQLDQKP